METLLEALGDEQPRALLLTHIHLDHAGGDRGAGAALARARGLRPRARRAAPDRSLEAAGQRRAPLRRRDGAPLGRDRAGAGGERARRSPAARTCFGMRVAYTPGHASHHVCYLHEESGTRLRRRRRRRAASRPRTCVVPPTPPPDIDIEAWERSLDVVESWRPDRLALTHFGAVEEPEPHIGAGPPAPAGSGRAGPASWTARHSSAHCATRSPPRWTPRPRPSCSRPCRPSTSGAASTATGASGTSDELPGGGHRASSAH